MRLIINDRIKFRLSKSGVSYVGVVSFHGAVRSERWRKRARKARVSISQWGAFETVLGNLKWKLPTADISKGI